MQVKRAIPREVSQNRLELSLKTSLAPSVLSVSSVVNPLPSSRPAQLSLLLEARRRKEKEIVTWIKTHAPDENATIKVPHDYLVNTHGYWPNVT